MSPESNLLEKSINTYVVPNWVGLACIIYLRKFWSDLTLSNSSSVFLSLYEIQPYTSWGKTHESLGIFLVTNWCVLA